MQILRFMAAWSDIFDIGFQLCYLYQYSIVENKPCADVFDTVVPFGCPLYHTTYSVNFRSRPANGMDSDISSNLDGEKFFEWGCQLPAAKFEEHPLDIVLQVDATFDDLCRPGGQLHWAYQSLRALRLKNGSIQHILVCRCHLLNRRLWRHLSRYLALEIVRYVHYFSRSGVDSCTNRADCCHLHGAAEADRIQWYFRKSCGLMCNGTAVWLCARLSYWVLRVRWTSGQLQCGYFVPKRSRASPEEIPTSSTLAISGNHHSRVHLSRRRLKKGKNRWCWSCFRSNWSWL